MKRILVPTDFSDHAESALKIASQIAKKDNSEIVLLHMLEIPNQMKDAISSSATIPEVILFIKKAQEKLHSIKSLNFLEGIAVSEVIQFEKAFDGILHFIKNNSVDLIVMGSHGVSGIEEILIGSNTEKIVRLSDVPVLVIKKETTTLQESTFVFASDFSKETEEPFKKMIEFTALFKAKLHLVMISTPNSFKTTADANEIIREFLKKHTVTNYETAIYNDINIEKGILNFSKSINADVIGLCTHGRTGLSHFFSGSIGEDVANHAVRPVITFKI
jgi:nucleotide-binding universal stress UspA family protein